MTAAGAEGLFLHASSVALEDGALLFLGHSTAGKSTLARLLGGMFPVLADDSVYAFRDAQGVWRVVDGSFRQEHADMAGWQEAVRRRAATGPSLRLWGCVRIHKASGARMEPLPPLETARCLMDAAMEIDVQRKYGRSRTGSRPTEPMPVRQMRRQWFRGVADIARRCPGWNLWFPMEFRGADLLALLFPAGRGFRRDSPPTPTLGTS